MTTSIIAGLTALALIGVMAATAVTAQQGQGAAPAATQDRQGGAAGPAQGRQGGQAGRAGGLGAPPPINWPEPPLPNGPILAQSAVAAHRDLRIMVTKGLSHPWAMQFL